MGCDAASDRRGRRGCPSWNMTIVQAGQHYRKGGEDKDHATGQDRGLHPRFLFRWRITRARHFQHDRCLLVRPRDYPLPPSGVGDWVDDIEESSHERSVRREFTRSCEQGSNGRVGKSITPTTGNRRAPSKGSLDDRGRTRSFGAGDRCGFPACASSRRAGSSILGREADRDRRSGRLRDRDT